MSSYCLDIVRKQDQNAFVISLCLPARLRPALWALFAFNYEISKTRDVVSDTTIGLIRLQWWRDAIQGLYEGRVEQSNPIIADLACAIETYDLPQDLFDKLIYAREFDLEGVAPANLEGLLHYCDYTTTPLFSLALKIVGETEDDTVLQSISIQYSLIRLLGAVPYMLNQRQLMLPKDILEQHSLSEKELFNFSRNNDVIKVIDQILCDKTAFRNDMTISKSGFLKAVNKSIQLYIGQIERCNGDVFDASMTQLPRFMALRVWLAIFF